MNIIELAKQAEFSNLEIQIAHENFARFAALVAAHEREACAKFCETNQVWVGKGKRGFSERGEDDFVTGGIHQGMDYAAAIRARGKT